MIRIFRRSDLTDDELKGSGSDSPSPSKAALAGVKVQPVDPRNTSRRCPECNHVSEKNRIRRDVFLCDECGYFDHADIVGAKNIRSGALVIAREVSVAAESRVSRETSSIYNRGAEAERFRWSR
jgi:hypothetical protein